MHVVGPAWARPRIGAAVAEPRVHDRRASGGGGDLLGEASPQIDRAQTLVQEHEWCERVVPGEPDDVDVPVVKRDPHAVSAASGDGLAEDVERLLVRAVGGGLLVRAARYCEPVIGAIVDLGETAAVTHLVDDVDEGLVGIG